ncbi:MAG: Rieske (2Fe-2S) protein [Candidatus Dormibacteraeota bacterium]|nr:Rieske (2Fe-2S) protein [Candidatus Dormibacteraeota bacterium]MBO0760802.1 Rieske (2Fe-2S) protein [Candidatus Dormibacteraeota bacterium]
MTDLTRRQVLEGAAGMTVLAITGAVAAACGGGQSSAGSAPAPTSSPPDGLAGKPLASTSDVPVGGGKILGSDHVVLTQPTKGTFKAFSSTCTHQGCTVGEVSDGAIKCPCHGSQFSATNGSVKQGPASRPLPQYQVKVNGSQLTLG